MSLDWNDPSDDTTPTPTVDPSAAAAEPAPPATDTGRKVKSALGNRGTWSAASADVRFQRAISVSSVVPPADGLTDAA